MPTGHVVKNSIAAAAADILTPIAQCVHHGGRRHSGAVTRECKGDVVVPWAEDGGIRWENQGLAATALEEFATPEALI
jgi:hypothetical protein